MGTWSSFASPMQQPQHAFTTTAVTSSGPALRPGADSQKWPTETSKETARFFLFWSSSDEIELRDHKGEVQWSQRWDRGIRELQMLDTDHDGKAELVYIDGKAVCIRDRQGTLLRRETIKEATTTPVGCPIKFAAKK